MAATGDALDLERMRADVARVLECTPAEIGDDDNLIDLDLDSMRMLGLVLAWGNTGQPLEFSQLAEHTTLRQWWDENYERTQDYYNSMLYREGPAPHPLPGWLARDIISRQLTSPSMLCVLSIQDWLAMNERLRLADADAERINIPANPRHYWRYRMHLYIEDLAANKEITQSIKDLVHQSGR